MKFTVSTVAAAKNPGLQGRHPMLHNEMGAHLTDYHLCQLDVFQVKDLKVFLRYQLNKGLHFVRYHGKQ